MAEVRALLRQQKKDSAEILDLLRQEKKDSAEIRTLLRQEKQKTSELQVALQKAEKLYQHTLEAKLQCALCRAKKSKIYHVAATTMRKLRKIFRRTENK